MNRIIFATGNAGKMVEVREILAGVDTEVLSMKEAGIKADIVEDGSTFEENALIKARAIHAQCGCLVLADDSGLEVDAMDKAPGIYSARFMGEDTSYEIKNQAIIDRLARLGGQRAQRPDSAASLRRYSPMVRKLSQKEPSKARSRMRQAEAAASDMIRSFIFRRRERRPQILPQRRRMRSATEASR